MSDLVRTSKFLSYVLRHNPDAIGLALDEHGWANISDLTRLGKISNEDLLQIVKEDEKQRYTISEDGKKIRAAQGHSIEIDLDLPRQVPPEFLYHGTASRFVEAIMEDGIIHASRQYVHLSYTKETAFEVGARHGKPAVLTVFALQMYMKGHHFYLSENGIWLTEHVPPEFIWTKIEHKKSCGCDVGQN